MKVNVWLNENMSAASRNYIIELFLPRAHSNYALLGIEFLAQGDGKCIIKWDIDCLKQERYSDAIALSYDTVIWGITDEFKEGIIKSLDYHRKEHMLPGGTITYNISAYGEIGSSADMFRRANDILLSLLTCGELNEAIIANIVQEKLDYKDREKQIYENMEIKVRGR